MLSAKMLYTRGLQTDWDGDQIIGTINTTNFVREIRMK